MMVKRVLIIGLLVNICGIGSINAQLIPMGSQYFQNQYLGNPAMAGLEEGLILNGGLRQQWSAISGAPLVQTLTAAYRSHRVGMGLNLYNDQAGLFKRTRAMGTYAYHLPLQEAGQQLHFGLSFGFTHERITTEVMDGDRDDLVVGQFNQRRAVFDGDFGVAYTSGSLTVQGAVPGLKNYLRREEYNTANWSTFFSSASYKLRLIPGPNNMTIEPLLAYRGVKGYKDIVDIGVNFSFAEDKLHLTGIYHSSGNMTFGLGMTWQSLSFLGMYSSQTAALKNYTSGNFEIGLGYRIRRGN